MGWPTGLPLRTCSLGPDFGIASGSDYGVDITVTASRPLMTWAATGAGALGDSETISIEPGAGQTLQLPVTDATGWLVGGVPVDVSGGQQSHLYNITIKPWQYDSAGRKKNIGSAVTLNNVAIPTGDGSTLDLDKSASMAGAGGGTVTVPDYVAQLEAVASAPTDAFVAGVVDNTTSQTRVALNGAYGRTLHFETQGAVGDGTNDDTAAIAATLALLLPGDTIYLTSGKTFTHSGVIDLTVADTHLRGAGTLLATDQDHSALYLTAQGVSVEGITKVVNQTSRGSGATDTHSIVMRGAGQTVRKVTVTGSRDVGIFVFGATDYLIDRPMVSNTAADGIHNTNGAKDGVIRHPRITNAGDDHIAVVSYSGDPAPVSNLTVTEPVLTCTGSTNGRGIAVVGGEDIDIYDPQIIDSYAASVYINVESGSFTARPIRRVRVHRPRILRPNTGWATISHGAILMGNSSTTSEINDAHVYDPTIIDAGVSIGTGAGRAMTFQYPGATGGWTNVTIERARLRGSLTLNAASNSATGVATSSLLVGLDYGDLATAARPSATNAAPGATYFDTTANAPGVCSGTAWTLMGAAADPEFTALASDQSNATTTAAALPGLAPAAVANATYLVRALVIYEASQTGDIKLSFTIPSGATLEWAGVGLSSSATAGSGSFSSLEVSGGGSVAAFGGAAIGTRQYVTITGVLVTAANAGTLQMNFAQATLDAANPTVVHAHSFLRLERVA